MSGPKTYWSMATLRGFRMSGAQRMMSAKGEIVTSAVTILLSIAAEAAAFMRAATAAAGAGCQASRGLLRFCTGSVYFMVIVLCKGVGRDRIAK